jgi:CRISPR-associated protein Csm3
MAEINLEGKIIIAGKVRAKTGLSVGGSTVGLDIGGLDNPVIKDAEGTPYLPGSSLKGKMRALLEKANGLASDDKRIYVVETENKISIHMCNDPDCEVCNIFGRTTRDKPYTSPSGGEIKIDKANVTPTRLIVRDAMLSEESAKKLREMKTDLKYTEVKWENVIDRITSAANPRQMERVPEGAKFEFEMIYNVFKEMDKSHLREVFKAMELVEHDYLGGSGSRGYGKVKFEEMGIYWNSKVDYENGDVDIEEKEPINGNYKTPASIVKNFEVIKEKIK